MKKIVAISAVAALMAVGGGTAGFLMLGSSDANAVGAPKAEEAAQAAPGFLKVGELVVPVARKGRVYGYVMIDAAVEFADETVAKSAMPWTPRIQDSWVRDLNGMADRGHFDAARIDIDVVKKNLLASAIEVLKSKEPRDVVLTKAIYQQAR
jgi:hypothetical protein